MTKLSPARRRALSALMEAQDGRGFVRDILAASAGTLSDARDEAFVLTLALGVTATVGALDEALDRYIAKPSKVSARVRMALRIPAFEMLYLDTPGHVAVSQGVELVRSQARSAAGLANAVLRRIDEGRTAFFAARDVEEGQREVVAAARRQGIPVWLARKIEASLAHCGHAEESLCFSGAPAPACICVRPGAVLSNSVSGCIEPFVLDGTYLVSVPSMVAASEDLAQGSLAVSDFNAQIIATSTVRSGSCLEIGAGRGTKTYVMACRASRCGLHGRHVAVDLSAAKCEINRQRLEQADLAEGIEFAPGDGCNLDATLAQIDVAGERILFDTVFLDAPCSGTGTMRRHPEIPWRLVSSDIEDGLPKLQLQLLREAARRVKPGGELIYATCSVLMAENEQVLDAFLQTEQGLAFEVAPLHAAFAFQKEPAAVDYLRAHEDERGLFQSFPFKPEDFDGHFCVRLIRRKA